MLLALTIILFISLVSSGFGGSVVKPVESKNWVIRATGNVSVPSADYILDAVECLRQAIGVYSMGDEALKFYVALFKQKHPAYRWNAVAGFTEIYLDMDYYVETVMTADKLTMKEKDKPTDSDIKFIIFAPKLARDIVPVTPSEVLPKTGNWSNIMPHIPIIKQI